MHLSGIPLATSFWDANPAYNKTNLILAAIGVGITILGFGITIWQLVETKGAATAAKEATEQTRRQLGELAAFIDMKTLGDHAGEVSGLLSSNNLHAVVLRSYDLRKGVARARESSRTKHLMEPEKWQETINKVVSIHELASQVLNQAGKRRLQQAEKMQSLRLINEVADEFHRLSAIVETKLQA